MALLTSFLLGKKEKMMTVYNYFNNTGGINKYSSEASLNESENKTDWWDSLNVEGHKSGGIVKMKGNRNILSPVLPADVKILGIYDYIKGKNHYLIFATSEGCIYRLDLESNTYVQVHSGFNTTARCCFANFNNGVVITNGVNSPIFYEEEVGASVLDDAPVGHAVAVYKARVFMAEGSILHYCALGKQTDWTSADDAGFIANFHNDSSPIVALKNYGEYLAIYKRQGVYVLKGSSPDEFVIEPVADKGTVSAWAVSTVDDNQYFFDGNVISVLRFNELGQIRLADEISVKIRSLFSDLDRTKLDQTTIIPYPQKNQIWFYMGNIGNLDLDICYIYDYLLNCWYKRVGPPVACGMLVDGKVYTGTSDGKILLEDSSYSFDGEPIEAFWYSPWFTFKTPGMSKQLNEFNIWLYQDQAYPVDILYSKDYSTIDVQFSTIIVMSNSDLIWDSDEFGIWDTFGWSNSTPVKKKITIPGSFETLQIGIRNLQADQPFAVIGFSFDVDVAP